MGMHVDGGDAKVRPEMNVTPLVDVVLVLLIIFMVLAPMVTKGLFVRVPPKDDTDTKLEQAAQPDQPLVLSVGEDGTLTVNSVQVGRDELSTRLHRMFNARPNNTLYLDGADRAPYGEIVTAVDAARKGGARPIVILTKHLAATKP